MKCGIGLVFLYILQTPFVLTSADAVTPWDTYNYSPASRNVKPVAVHSQSGNVTILPERDGNYHLAPGSSISLDFGVEVGGWINLRASISNASITPTPHFSLAFAESPAFVRAISDDTGATPTQDWDQALNVTLPSGSTLYTTPAEKFRGGFRFLTINALTNIQISNITCTIGFAPNTPNLRNYGGHFYTPDDDLLVRIWYAGAYTVQTNIAPQDTGRWLPQVRPGWAYNNSIGVTGPLLVDGAKRDRAIWPGDLGIQGLTAFLALGADGLESVRNALDTLCFYQNATTGRFPFAGPATGSFRNGAQSDTYHAWSLIALFNYAIWTGDAAWVGARWENITAGMEFILRGLDNEVGLHEQTRANDWARQGGGGYNSALNALDYHALRSFGALAASLSSSNDTKTLLLSPTLLTAQSSTYTTAATRLKSSFNTLLLSSSTSPLYTDNTTTSLTPQDGNALALLYNLPLTASHSSLLSTALTHTWSPIGPLTPELPDTISPFISSIELLAHMETLHPRRAMNLTRTLWRHLLQDAQFTGSTFAEGLSANGSLAYRATAGYKFDAAYTSLAHGWSTGPTGALSAYIGGLEIVGWREWRFRPQSDGVVREVDVGFQSPMGGFGVQWKISGEEGRFGFEAEVVTALGTRGTVEVVWGCERVEVDGVVYRGEVLEGGREIKVRASGCVWGDEN